MIPPRLRVHWALTLRWETQKTHKRWRLRNERVGQLKFCLLLRVMIRQSRTKGLVSHSRGQGRQVLEVLREVRRGDLELNTCRKERALRHATGRRGPWMEPIYRPRRRGVYLASSVLVSGEQTDTRVYITHQPTSAIRYFDTCSLIGVTWCHSLH